MTTPLPIPMFNWQQKQRNIFTTAFEVLFKDQLTGAKKWVITNRSKITMEPTGKSRSEFYGPNDEGPFKTEADLIKFLPHQTFSAECPICTHKMQIVCLVGTKTVNCTKCKKEIEVPTLILTEGYIKAIAGALIVTQSDFLNSSVIISLVLK